MAQSPVRVVSENGGKGRLFRRGNQWPGRRKKACASPLVLGVTVLARHGQLLWTLLQTLFSVTGLFPPLVAWRQRRTWWTFRWVVTGQNTWNSSSRYCLYICFTSTRLFRNYPRFTAYWINISRAKPHSLRWINNAKWVILYPSQQGQLHLEDLLCRKEWAAERDTTHNLLLRYERPLFPGLTEKFAHIWRRAWACCCIAARDKWLTHSVCAGSSCRCSPRSWTETGSWWRGRWTAETQAHLKEEDWTEGD